MTGAGRYAVDRLRSRGVPMNEHTEALVCHLVDAAPAHRHTHDSLHAADVSQSTARWWCAKKRLPSPSRWQQLGRALNLAAQIQAGATAMQVAERMGYSDHTAVSRSLQRTLGMGAAQVRRADLTELLDGWLARQVDGVDAEDQADARFRKVRKPCSGPYRCDKQVNTMAYVAAPICRSCRRRMKNLKLAPYRLKWGS